MSKSDPVSAFYNSLHASGAMIVKRHLYLPQVNRFIFMARVSTEEAALNVAKQATLILGCKDPQCGFIKRRNAWHAWGLYRPLIDAPAKDKTNELETV